MQAEEKIDELFIEELERTLGGEKIVPLPIKLGAAKISSENYDELQSAKKDFEQQNYEEAFKKFYKLANEDISEAIDYLIIMYMNGMGTERDDERYNFWLKEAAKSGHGDAQYAYAKKILTDNSMLSSEYDEGLKLLAKAADKKVDKATKDYVDLVYQRCTYYNNYVKPFTIKKAIKYCNMLIDELPDKYESNQYTNKKGELRHFLRASSFKHVKPIIHFCVDFIAYMTIILASAYWFIGVHPNTVNENVYLQWLPNVKEQLILPIDAFWKFFANYMNLNGQFGIELSIVSSILYQIAISKKWNTNNKFRRNGYIFSGCISLIFIILHYVPMIQEREWLGFEYIIPVILFVVPWVLSMIIAMLIRKLTEKK